MGESGLVISVSGIRGVVGEALTPEVVATYAAAHGAVAAARTGRRATCRETMANPDAAPHRHASSRRNNSRRNALLPACSQRTTQAWDHGHRA